MDALGAIRDLLAHMQWADATIWAAVRRLDSGDPDLRDRLRHLHATQRAFLQVWRSEPVRLEPPEDLQQWAQSYYAELAPFLSSVDADALDRVMNMPWADRYSKHEKAHATTLAETLIQIASHSTYHRGQVNMRIRQLGGEPPQVDYIAWLWLGRPEADWSTGFNR
ncbi:MAG TPA: DinB family protein [Thermoanaerobaculia bacterium]|nr:DinB family protein [Thermoanaerobaculia bacterium]